MTSPWTAKVHGEVMSLSNGVACDFAQETGNFSGMEYR